MLRISYGMILSIFQNMKEKYKSERQTGNYLITHVMIRKTNNQQVRSFCPMHPFPVP